MAANIIHDMHPYYRAILEAYAELDRPYYHQVSPDAAREMLKSSLAAAPPAKDLPLLEEVSDISFKSGQRSVAARSYRPSTEIMGICVYLHAGGWVIGDLDTGDATCRRLAAGTQCEVINVDYCLAPENPFPSSLEDVITVLQSVAERGLPVVVVGESAGGNLAAAAAIQLRDSGKSFLAGQLLAYPVTDCDFTTESYRELGGCNYLLSEADMRWFWNHYCPSDVDRKSPLVSPLQLDDLVGLPSALIIVAGLDPLRDEGLAYAQKLAAAGVPVQTRCDPGVLHGYLSMVANIPSADEALNQACEWVCQRVESAV
ncbi:alpha/beta hydrolase [Halioxenophilus sp. WMMB6]|uniref:alpha/beta hydrolase n=1 Tax=Halioxenophilus sp. WMMB6 TaxID=3073815 RepID=UPI00295F19F8|nr:alpha/beta hydrolase [Halioxenophilus sp. WMMB6]